MINVVDLKTLRVTGVINAERLKHKPLLLTLAQTKPISILWEFADDMGLWIIESQLRQGVKYPKPILYGVSDDY